MLPSLLSFQRNLGVLIFKDFRPISLVSGVYKIIAKILANRLRRVVEKIISKSQNAFVQGRQILDSILFANEYMDGRIRLVSQGCFANWIFRRPMIILIVISYLLMRCGFRGKWRS
jgi:hypothetical protein